MLRPPGVAENVEIMWEKHYLANLGEKRAGVL